MKVSVELHKIIKCTIHSIVFLLFLLFFLISGGGIDDVLLRLSLIEQIIKDANLMFISFSVKHPATFRES